MNARSRFRLLAVLGAPLVVVLACRTAGAHFQAPPGPDRLQAGIALFQQGKYPEAEAELRQASGPEASAYLAASLAKQKKYPEAEPPAKSALEAVPLHAVALAALGESLVGQKKYDEAVTRLSAAIEKKADLAYAYLWRGQAYNVKKDHARMVTDFETFLRLAPQAPEAPTIRQFLAGIR